MPGTVRTKLVTPNPQGGPPLAPTTYTRRVRTVDGPREERCGEPGRVVDDEVGPYEPSWASFLESPPFAHLQRPEGDWQPVLPRAGQIGSCR